MSWRSPPSTKSCSCPRRGKFQLQIRFCSSFATPFRLPSPHWGEVERVVERTDDLVLATHPRPSFAHHNDEKRKSRGSGAPRGASNRGRPLFLFLPFRGGGRGGVGSAPCDDALAFRRSTCGACQSERTLQLSPGHASRDEEGCGRYPRHRSRLSQAPGAPVVMPEGTMPRPPGSGVTSPARRNRARSMIRCVSRSRPR
jgi:hypothetical protein